MKNTFVHRVSDLERILQSGAKLRLYHRNDPTTEHRASVDLEAATVAAMVSTPDVDSYGDIVEPLGGRFERFRKNPMVPWSHNYELPPVAVSEWEEASEDGIRAQARFLIDKVEMAAQVFQLYASHVMRAWSIGFMPVKGAWEEIKGENESPTGGIRFIEWDMLEYSPVVIPANENALTLMAKGVMTAARTLHMKDARSGDTDLGRLVAADRLIRSYPELAEPDGLQKMVEDAIREEVQGTAPLIEIRNEMRVAEALAMMDEIKAALTAGGQ